MLKKYIDIKMLCLFTAALSILAACGGGGGGAGGAAPAPKTKAIVKLSTQGTTVSQINGVQATVALPSGVSVKATGTQTDANVVTGSGNGSSPDLVMGIYSAATGTVTAYVFKTNGIAVGEFATVTCDIASGTSPATSGFTVSGLKASDQDGKEITGLSLKFTVVLE